MKPNYLSLTIILLFFSLLSSSQIITFQKLFIGSNSFTYHPNYSIIQSSDSGFVIASVFKRDNTTSYVEACLIKTNKYGDTLWTKKYGNANGDDFANSVIQTNDGGYIFTGLLYVFNTSANRLLYIVKTDGNGDTLWTKAYSRSSSSTEGHSIKQTTDGGFIIAGTATNAFNPASGSDGLIFKIDSVGNILWSKIYNFGTVSSSGDEIIYSIEPTIDGGYIATGSENNHFFLLKTDSIGNVTWLKFFKSTVDERSHNVLIADDSGYVISGYTNSFGGPTKPFIIKTNSNGDTLWTKKFNFIANSSVESQIRTCKTTNGGFTLVSAVIIPPYGNNLALIKMDSVGNIEWANTYGNSYYDFGHDVVQTFDGGYVAVGINDKLVFNTPSNILMVKTDSNGNSNCNQLSFSPLVSSAPFIVNDTSFVVGSTLNVFSPPTAVNSGLTDSTICLTVGINEITENNPLLIFPNPSCNNLVVTIGKIINNGKIEIINSLGKVVYHSYINQGSKNDINLTNIPSGIYVVQVRIGDIVYSKKLVVSNN